MTTKRIGWEILSHPIRDHVARSTIQDLDGASRHTFAQRHDTEVNMTRARLDGVFRKKTTGAIVLIKRGLKKLRGAGIFKDVADPGDDVGAWCETCWC